MLNAAGFDRVTLDLPTFPAAQRAHFPLSIRAIANVYNAVARLPVSRHALFAIGPKLMAGGTKSG